MSLHTQNTKRAFDKFEPFTNLPMRGSMTETHRHFVRTTTRMDEYVVIVHHLSLMVRPFRFELRPMSKMHQQARKEKISVRARAYICENEQTAQTHIIYVSGEQSFADNSIFIIDTLTINAVRSRDARILFIKSTQSPPYTYICACPTSSYKTISLLHCKVSVFSRVSQIYMHFPGIRLYAVECYCST